MGKKLYSLPKAAYILGPDPGTGKILHTFAPAMSLNRWNSQTGIAVANTQVYGELVLMPSGMGTKTLSLLTYACSTQSGAFAAAGNWNAKIFPANSSGAKTGGQLGSGNITFSAIPTPSADNTSVDVSAQGISLVGGNYYIVEFTCSDPTQNLTMPTPLWSPNYCGNFNSSCYFVDGAGNNRGIGPCPTSVIFKMSDNTIIGRPHGCPNNPFANCLDQAAVNVIIARDTGNNYIGIPGIEIKFPFKARIWGLQAMVTRCATASATVNLEAAIYDTSGNALITSSNQLTDGKIANADHWPYFNFGNTGYSVTKNTRLVYAVRPTAGSGGSKAAPDGWTVKGSFSLPTAQALSTTIENARLGNLWWDGVPVYSTANNAVATWNVMTRNIPAFYIVYEPIV